MDAITLVLYGLVNLFMVLSYLIRKGDVFKLPFWIGIISLGWFYPQAIGGYYNIHEFPGNSYAEGMLFASFCSIGVWIGWILAYTKPLNPNSWLNSSFNQTRLYWVGSFLSLGGFYFQWLLWQLPEDMLADTQWSGLTVQYFFLSQIFKFGFLILWFLYLNKNKLSSFRFFVFLIPCFLLFIDAVVLRGRRAEMMNLASFILISLYFIRGFLIPRWLMIICLIFGIVFINAIGVYRSIMKDTTLSFEQRIDMALSADYLSDNQESLNDSGEEFKNYIYIRAAVGNEFNFDYGVYHWNQFVFNYIPAQLVGPEVKNFLTIPIGDTEELVKAKYGHSFYMGTTVTGYADAFSSFGWFGFIKFILIGWISSILFKYAESGRFLAQILYI